MLGFPELEVEEDIGVAELLPAPSVSLSLALSAMAVPQCYGADDTQICSDHSTKTDCAEATATALPAGSLQNCHESVNAWVWVCQGLDS